MYLVSGQPQNLPWKMQQPPSNMSGVGVTPSRLVKGVGQGNY